jgi:hypothetical protein
VDDLKLTPKDPEPPKVAARAARRPKPAELTPVAEKIPPGAEASPPAAGGKVSVSVDQITKPGAIVSGKVTFSDGQMPTGIWTRRAGSASCPSSRATSRPPPTCSNFQLALQQEVAKLGY